MANITRYLGPKGYSISKTSLSSAEEHKVREDLTVKAFIPPNSIQKASPFPIYRESNKKLYVPRFYGFEKYGQPQKINIANGMNINVPFEGTLRDYQTKIITAYINATKRDGCGLLEIPCGRGKCLGYDTPILMFDWSIKMVQDIQRGDIIMGDDFTSRKVFGITRGKSKLYSIHQSNGMSYVVNDVHILSLFDINRKIIMDISIMNYLELVKHNEASHLYGIRVFDSGEYILSNLTITENIPQTSYYGFYVNKNHRFLLGDHTVTHNTVMALNIISILKKKTLVIVHKEFLMDQWKERIQQFLPTARIGRIQGSVVDIENKDIVLGMLQSLSMKEYPDVKFDKHFGLTIIDEVHHISAEVFCRSLFKIVTNYMLGLSATMTRKDGLTKVFKMFLGKVVYKEERVNNDAVVVRCINYKTTDEEFSKVAYNFKGQTHYAIMIRKLCEFNLRSEFILKVLKDTLDETPNQQIMILAHNKSLLKYLYDAIEYRNIATVGYYVGGMKQKALKETEGKQIVIATYAMAEEALDIKTLATLIMATPKTSVVQAVGRILRMKHKNPLVIDIVDQHDIFQRQWVKRRRFYMKSNYKIITNDSVNYNNNYDTWDIIYEPGKNEKKFKKKIYKSEKSKLLQGKCMLSFTGTAFPYDPSK